MGNSLGRAPLGGSDILRSRAVGTSFQDKFHQCDCPAKLCAEDFSSANVGRWDTHSFVTGSDTKNAQLLARFFSGQISSIRLFRKLCGQDLPKFPNPGPWNMHSFVDKWVSIFSVVLDMYWWKAALLRSIPPKHTPKQSPEAYPEANPQNEDHFWGLVDGCCLEIMGSDTCFMLPLGALCAIPLSIRAVWLPCADK